ncbi:MAG: hypothetical protein MJK10_07460 [Pseudomonadales bacterium]|nr:hypothetical protein [Pseudomonadales bacterium]NRA15659.1 hypothetical protein [Oceanospirillaceae bacterium]
MHPPRIIFYVQYLLGIGHVRRATLIVQALCRQGAKVDVIFGGMPVPSMSFGAATVHHLTAVKSADAAFNGLVKADGSVFSNADKTQRSRELLNLCQQLQADLIVTETYPFGRRQMRFELLPLLQWVKSQPQPPLLVASVRDILQRRSEKREQECIALVQQHYQQVLVHGDPNFYPLQQSFPPAAAINDKINYSGYVCPELHQANEQRPENGKIVVSIGGGSVGREILAAALTLYQSGFASDRQWLLITGPNMSPADKAYFHSHSDQRLSVVELADNFLQQLSSAYVSVSMAGYNTVMDLLLTKVAAVVIPFEGEGETEQLARSEVLAEEGVFEVLRNGQLSSDNLRLAINSATSQPAGAVSIDSDGADNSARLLIDWALQRRNSITNV